MKRLSRFNSSLIGYEIDIEEIGNHLAKAVLELENASIDLMEEMEERLLGGEDDLLEDFKFLVSELFLYYDRVPEDDSEWLTEDGMIAVANASYDLSKSLAIYAVKIVEKGDGITDTEVSFVNSLIYSINVFDNLNRLDNEFSEKE